MEKNKKEYTILGNVYKAKPLKLQLHKESFFMIQKLNEHIKTAAGLTSDELKGQENSFAVSLAMMGFLSDENNCAEVLQILLEGDEDWKELIIANKDKYEEIKLTAIKILNDFF